MVSNAIAMELTKTLGDFAPARIIRLISRRAERQQVRWLRHLYGGTVHHGFNVKKRNGPTQLEVTKPFLT